MLASVSLKKAVVHAKNLARLVFRYGAQGLSISESNLDAV